MIDVVINNDCYSFPATWNELTLERAMALDAILDEAPAQLRAHFANSFEPSAHESELTLENSTPLRELYYNIFSTIGEIPEQIARICEPDNVREFVDLYLTTFVISLIFEPIFEPQHIKWFYWQGERLMLPQSTQDINGCLIPSSKLSAEELCCATDLYIASNVKYAATIVALLCRPEAEQYSLDKALLRAKTMAKLPMSIIFEVFFCSQTLISI